jgi:PilZ domain-containing protein
MHGCPPNDGERKSSLRERRSEPRSPIQASLLLSAGDAVIGATGTTRDVSKAGVYFYTDAPLTVGQVVDLKIRPQNVELPFACNGTIVRVDNGNSAASHHARGVSVRVNSICLCGSAECA